MIEEIAVGLIYRSSNARAIRQDNVENIAASITEIGLLNPIIVRKTTRTKGTIPFDAYEIVAGHHRYAAVKLLKWKSVSCNLLEIDGLHAQLAEIDENLMRAGLSPAQEAFSISRRKEIYELLYPETRHGGNTGGPSGEFRHSDTISFTNATAKATGKAERTIRQAATRGKRLGVELKEIEGTSLDKSKEIDALSAMPPDERRKIIDRAKAGENVSAIKNPKPNPDQIESSSKENSRSGFDRLMAAWKAASEDDRSKFFKEISSAYASAVGAP